jgi:hypothetical protein
MSKACCSGERNDETNPISLAVSTTPDKTNPSSMKNGDRSSKPALDRLSPVAEPAERTRIQEALEGVGDRVWSRA